MMNKIKALFMSFKVARTIIVSEDMQSKGNYSDALKALISVNHLVSGKDYRYHLNLGRIYSKSKNDYSKAIDEFEKSILLINEDSDINVDEREYLLAWAKYMKGWCLYDLGNNFDAEKCRSECEKHYFNINKVPKGIKILKHIGLWNQRIHAPPPLPNWRPPPETDFIPSEETYFQDFIPPDDAYVVDQPLFP